MKKFVNETSDQTEYAIKLGSSVPGKSIGLSYFSTNKISPSENISVIDLSETIPENVSFSSTNATLTNDNEAILAFSDELGFLRTIDGQYTFNSDEVTIGNLFIDQKTETKEYNINNVNPNNFSHYFYISKFFIPLLGEGFTLLSLDDYIDPEKLKNVNLKVLDKNNEDYVDKNTGRKKYRFLLEPFVTSANKLRSEIPYRVIVLLDATEPDGLRLVYDKIECDEYGSMFHIELNYTETINAIKFFSEIPEESFAIDDNYYKQRVYSIKKLNQKYFDLTLSRQVDNGYQIVTSTKGISDYRVFENFNWRLIARTRRNISFDQLSIDSANTVAQTIKAGVLCSSSLQQSANSVIYPYVFNRLYNSPFNLGKYFYINPLRTTTIDRTSIESAIQSADYWKVDIDLIDSLDKFDILAWAPTGNITSNQVRKIQDFLLKNGTLILDLSNCPSTTAQLLNNQLVKSVDTYSSEYTEMNLSNPLLDYTKNGGWTINESIFEKEEYGLFGSNYLFNNGIYKTYTYFDSTTSENNFLKVGATSSSTKSIGTLIPYVSSADALVRGNVIAVTFPLMGYCNSIYNISSPEQIVDGNFGSTCNNSQNENIYPGIVEGPFKLLYNISTFAAYCRLKAPGEVRTNSSLYNFVCPWKSDWVLDKDALLESELSEFTKVNVTSSIQITGKDLDKTKNSILDTYKSALDNFLPDYQRDSIFGIPNVEEIEFFIEVTNPDVELYNASRITESSFNVGENIPSAYNLFKVTDGTEKVYAYTTKPSPSLIVPSNMGAYAVIEKNYSSSNDASLINSLGTVLNSFRSYPFELKTSYAYLTSMDQPYSYDVNGTISCNMLFKGSYTYDVTTTTTVDGGSTTTPVLVDTNAPCIEIKSAIDDLDLLREEGSSNPNNIYLYSGDIDIHKDPRLWRNGSPTHEYVKYIQYTVKYFTGKTCVVDGIYGPQTEGVVKTFQINGGQRYLDGTVDSETKSYMAFAWKKLKKDNLTKFNELRTATTSDSNLTSVTKYIDAAINAGTAPLVGSKVYKKITFSGFTGPSQGFDVIYFKIPNNFEKLNKVVLQADSTTTWQNFDITVCGYSSTFKSDVFQTTPVTLNKSATNGKIEIIFDPNSGVDANQVRYMWVAINARALTNYGYAEGFSISSIRAYGKVTELQTIDNPDTEVTTVTPTTVDIYALANVKFNTKFDDVSVDNSPSLTYSTSSIPRATAWVDSIQIGYPTATGMTGPLEGLTDPPITIDLPNQTYYLNDNSYKYFSNNKFKFNFGISPEKIEMNSFSVVSILADGAPIPPSPSPVAVTYVNSSTKTSFTVKAETSAGYYSDSQYLPAVEKDLSTGYRLKTPDGYIFSDFRNTINVNDGILLLCTSTGSSFGLPTTEEITQAAQETESVLDQETDLRFGNLTVSNNTANESGFIYGFYDNSQKEFIGKKLSYLDIIARGIQNIFVAVAAIDADGNTTNRNEFIGPTVSTTFIPVNVPLKFIAPIYSVKFKRSSSIRINPIDSNLTKFDAWELPVSSGSFWKTVNISKFRNWTGWKANYVDQNLRAYYTTLDQIPVNWSSILGTGYYDISDESPVLVDDRTIQLRRVPLATINYQTNYKSSRVGILKQPISIYIRDSELSDWNLVKEELIKDIDCVSGKITFKSRIVPNRRNLIKVNYSTIDKSNLVKQINGNPIPLNPLLNSESIDFDEPLYIYISPKVIYKYSFDTGGQIGVPTFQMIQEYNCESVVNFTYDSSMFDNRSSNYDPFALLIAIIYVNNNPYRQQPNLADVRVRGGGVVNEIASSELINGIPNILSYWDVYPPSGEAYPKGGYVIIRIPEEVKDNFIDENEIYNIISNNLTAGIVYDLQDIYGNNWT